MGEFLRILLFASMPAVGNFVGGLLAEWLKPSPRILSFALHAAAGIVLGVVAVEIMPRALRDGSAWLSIAAFVAGGASFVGLDKLMSVAATRGARCGDERRAKAWLIYFGVAVDLFSDGVLVGGGGTLNTGLALLLASGQVPADVPEGFATIANLRRMNMPRARRLLMSAAFAIPLWLGVTLGYWALRDAPTAATMAVLAFTAGMLMTAAVEEMVPEAHEEEDSRIATLMLVAGFALFAAISTALG